MKRNNWRLRIKITKCTGVIIGRQSRTTMGKLENGTEKSIELFEISTPRLGAYEALQTFNFLGHYENFYYC